MPETKGLMFNASETATILYALRQLQDDFSADTRDEMRLSAHFSECKVPTASAIDKLCERINCGGK